MKLRSCIGVLCLITLLVICLPTVTGETDSNSDSDKDPFERVLPIPFNSYKFNLKESPKDKVEFVEYNGLYYWIEKNSKGEQVAQLVNVGVVTEGQVIRVPEFIMYNKTKCQVVSVGICIQPFNVFMYSNNGYICHVGITRNQESQSAPTLPTSGIGTKDADVHYSIVFEGTIKVQDYAFTEFDIFRTEGAMIASYLTKSGLTSVTFEKGATSIGQQAFAHTCINDITIPETVSFVGEGAFLSTFLLNTVHWKSDADIPDNAFHGTSISEISIEGNPKRIGLSAFEKTRNLNTIVIPDSVISIDRSAFQWSGLKSVSIGNGVEVIPSACFLGNYDLNEVKITNSLKEIGGSAFKDTSLTSFDFSGIETMGSYAFYCAFLGTEMVEVELSSIKSIGDHAFQACTSPIKLTLSTSLESIGVGAFAFKGDLEGTDIVIPDNCTVGASAFYALGLTSVSFGNYCEIGDRAFSNCSKLKSVSFGENCVLLDSKTTPNVGVFGKSAIEKLTIPASLTLGRGSFFNCEQLKEITFENGRTEIARSFEGCTNLTQISFPDELKFIADYAFKDCSALDISKNVLNTSPEDVLKWGPIAFSGTKSIETYNLFEGDLEGTISFLKLTLMVDGAPKTHSFLVDITGATNSMKLDAPYEYEYTMPEDFAGFTEGIMHKKMPKFNFPNKIYQTYDGAVYSSDGFTLIKVPFNQLSLAIPENVITIAPYACYQTYLTVVKFPASVTDIGENAFFGCNSLSVVELNEGLKNIGDYAFSLTALKEITLPATVEVVGVSSFYNLAITIPSNSKLTYVDNWGLNVVEGGSVLIPSSLKSAGDIPFGYKMSKVYLTDLPSTYPENILRSADKIVDIDGNEVLAHPYDVAFYLPLGTDISGISFEQLLGCERGYFGGYYVNTSNGPLVVDDSIDSTLGTIYFYAPSEHVSISGYVPDGEGIIISLTVGTWTEHDVQYSIDKGSVMPISSESPYVLKIKVSGVVNGSVITICERVSDETVRITFESNGGTYCSSISIGKGRTISENNYPVPTKNRSEFSGWVDVAGNVVREYSPISSDITLYAKWIDANPRLIFDEHSHMAVIINDTNVNNGYRVSSEDEITIQWIPFIEGYSFDYWVVTSHNRSERVETPTYLLTNITDDTEIILYERYYNPSDNIHYINSVEFSEDTNALYLQWTTAFKQNTENMRWTGGSGTPLVVNDRLYTRAGDTIYMYDLDTGRVLKTVESMESGSFYHYLGYANDMIFDYTANKVYNLNLEYLCDAPIPILKLLWDDTGIYMFSGAIYKYSLDLKTLIWTFNDGYCGYSNWGSPGGIQLYDGYLYWVGLTKNKEITLQSVDTETGTDFHEIIYSDYKNYLLDDGWITCADGAIFLGIYSTGLFGESYGLGGGILATTIDKGAFSSDYKYYELTEKSQSNFIVYNGRGYINSGHYFYVFDVDGVNLTEVYCYKHLRYTHGGITLNIPPGSESVEILFIPYDPIATVVMFIDQPGQILPKYKYLGCEVVVQYNTQAVRFTDDGRIYFYNDIGNVFVLGKKNDTTFLMIRENDRVRCVTYNGTVEEALSELKIPETYYGYMLDGFFGTTQIEYDSTLTSKYRLFYFSDVPLTSSVGSSDLQWYSEEYGVMTISDIKLGNLYLDGEVFQLIDRDEYKYSVKFIGPGGTEIKSAYVGLAAAGTELDYTELTIQIIVGYRYVGASKDVFKISIDESKNIISLRYAALTPVVINLKESVINGTATVSGLLTIADEGNSIEILLPEGRMSLDNSVLKNLGTDEPISVSLVKVDMESLGEELRRNIPQVATIFNITMKIGEEYVTDLGGTAKIAIPIQLSGKNVAVWYLTERGEMNKIEEVEFSDGSVSFTTNHFSYYVIEIVQEEADNDKGSILIICVGVALVILIIVGLGLINRRGHNL